MFFVVVGRTAAFYLLPHVCQTGRGDILFLIHFLRACVVLQTCTSKNYILRVAAAAAAANAHAHAGDAHVVDRTNAGLIREAIASIARGDRVAVEGGPQKLELKVILRLFIFERGYRRSGAKRLFLLGGITLTSPE